MLLLPVASPSVGGIVVSDPPCIDCGGGVKQLWVGTKLLPLRLL